MMGADWLQLLRELEAMGLKVIEVNQPLGRITVEIPDLEER